jgi:hypothetical protein
MKRGRLKTGTKEIQGIIMDNFETYVQINWKI